MGEPEELLAADGIVAYARKVFIDAGVKPEIPPIKADKAAWFEFWDEDGSKSLEKEELLRALVHTFRLEQDYGRVRTMRECIDNMWCLFDDDGSGSIEMDEFISPDSLANCIIATMDHV